MRLVVLALFEMRAARRAKQAAYLQSSAEDNVMTLRNEAPDLPWLSFVPDPFRPLVVPLLFRKGTS
jgi:hypothetical protein